jgi:putative transposase
MKRSRSTEEQIIAILREQEAGVPVADLCRKHCLSSPTFYKCKAKYGALDVSEARRLKALEDETPATSSAAVRGNKLTIVSGGARDARAAAVRARSHLCRRRSPARRAFG